MGNFAPEKITWVGDIWSAVEPIPNCPSELSPQQYKALKLSKVQVWEPPKEIVFEPEPPVKLVINNKKGLL